MKFRVGDKVNLYNGEKAVVIRTFRKPLEWFPYKVRVTKGIEHKKGKILRLTRTQVEGGATNGK